MTSFPLKVSIICLSLVFECLLALGTKAQAREENRAVKEPKVDFSYAFAMPHRMTVALPDSSDKTVVDVYSDHLELKWTYGNLKSIPLGAFMPLACNWSASVWPEIDGRRPAIASYGRSKAILPVLHTTFKDADGLFEMELVGGNTAAINRVQVTNTGDKPHKYALVLTMNGGFGEVPGYINAGEPTDYVLAGWMDRADRVLAAAIGAATPLRRDTPARTLGLEWNLHPGKTGRGWLVRPYKAYEHDVAALRSHNWSKEFEKGKQTWRDLLGRAVRFNIPDDGVRNGYYASLGDIFIMREPVAKGYTACCPGTEGYRCPNSGEASMAAVGLDQAGLHREAAIGYQLSIDMQGKNGDWNDPKGWSHRGWGMAGFKAWTVVEHYKLTGNRSNLEKVFPRLLACSRWQETQRAKTRVLVDGKRPLYYGLMPRGQGDCGLDAGDGWYGYFLPHNAWAVYADKVALETAEILGKSNEAVELRSNYESAYTDFMTSMNDGAIQADGYRWIPGSPGNPAGSRWGVLNTAFPCELLPPNHELITGTLKYMNRKLSSGGLQMHTGWMADGMWVAISLDNVAEVELQRNNGDEAVRLLYACLNHGTPLYTWCEERGEEPGTPKTSGDRQHLWTPAAVVRATRDCMVMEEDAGLHLARGSSRSWLASGKDMGVEKAPTHFGDITYKMHYDAAKRRVAGTITFPKRAGMEWCTLHVRLPDGLKVKSINPASNAQIQPGGESIRWTKPSGNVTFDVEIG